MRRMFRPGLVLAGILAAACSPADEEPDVTPPGPDLSAKVAQYTSVRLDPDLPLDP